MAIHGVTEQPALLLTCAAARPPVAATTFASRGSVRPVRVRTSCNHPGYVKPFPGAAGKRLDR
jgi:hypothetical protein